jgi:glycosyltransferase involved in cell wall biosynthesis
MRVLVSAYACEPDKGSEPGAGWNWALAAAREHDVTVITRANNREPIERAHVDGPRPRFVYVDLPPWARRWKRGQRGVRLYYLLWQIAAAREARRLHHERPFDVVHHLTFANVWLPALVCLVDAPFVLGPVGGGPRVPLRLYSVLGVRGALREAALVAGRLLSRANPLVRLAWRRAAVILVQNEETLRALPRRYRARARVAPNASVSEPIAPTRTPSLGAVAMYAGRLLPWKGVALAIDALTLLPAWRLVVVGRGPDERRLRRLAVKRGVDPRVVFVPWMPRERLWERLGACRVLVVPSLREDASLAAAEANALGVPVVALRRGGPKALAATAGSGFELVPPAGRRRCVQALADALAHTKPVAPGSAFGPRRAEGVLAAAYRAARRSDIAATEAAAA